MHVHECLILIVFVNNTSIFVSPLIFLQLNVHVFSIKRGSILA